MANRTLLAFRRRHNEDGTWDSICLRCYRTAASARDATWLQLLQSTHTCDPMDLHAWMSDRPLLCKVWWTENAGAIRVQPCFLTVPLGAKRAFGYA
jgi:hypothetical protein